MATEAGVARSATTEEWSRARRVRVGRWELRYREAGRGAGIALVHGLGMSADYWRRNGPALAAAGFRVAALDLPGFGRTAGPRRGLTVQEQAAVAGEWAEAVGLGPAVFVGHSISCQTVLQLATTAPTAVAGLILAAPTEGGGAGTMARQARDLFRDAWREQLDLLLLATACYLRAGPVRYWNTWRHGVGCAPLELAPRVAAPALVVVGTSDPVVPRPFAEALAATLPRGRMSWIPDAAHAVSFDRPDAFNALAARFAGASHGTAPALPPE